MTGNVMHQEAPYPQALAEIIGHLEYKPGWTFRLADIDRGQGSKGLTFEIIARVPDSYNPDNTISVWHYMTVPPAAFDVRSWRRWVFEQILLVERHEAMEYFQAGGERCFAPSHGPGNDPYLIREVGTELDQRTSFTGAVNPLRFECEHQASNFRPCPRGCHS